MMTNLRSSSMLMLPTIVWRSSCVAWSHKNAVVGFAQVDKQQCGRLILFGCPLKEKARNAHREFCATSLNGARLIPLCNVLEVGYCSLPYCRRNKLALWSAHKRAREFHGDRGSFGLHGAAHIAPPRHVMGGPSNRTFNINCASKYCPAGPEALYNSFGMPSLPTCLLVSTFASRSCM